jgi:hypothetical protein
MPSRIHAMLFGRMDRVIAMGKDILVGRKLAGDPVARKTGRLADSVRTEPAAFVDSHTIRASIVAAEGDAFYGRSLETGSDMHQITAVRARALRFVSKDNAVVFVRSVTHLGISPRWWMRSTRDELEPLFRSEIKEGLDDIFRE